MQQSHRRIRFWVIIGLLLAVGAIAGGVFWSQWQADSPHSASPPPVATSAGPPSLSQDEAASEAPRSPHLAYLVIQEWGVRIALPSELQAATYSKADTYGGEAMGFSTSELQSHGECQARNGGLGVLERSQVPLTTPAGNARAAIKHIGGYYYYFSSPQASCLEADENPHVTSMLDSQSRLLSEAINSLEAAP